MSATLETAAIASFLGDAPIIESEGRAHPVRIHHLPPSGPPFEAARPAAVRAGVAYALENQTGDVLVFLPGVGEIKRAAGALASLVAEHDTDIVELFGDLASEQQDRALRAGPGRRVVLATNVAESSVTVAGVGAVVDSGLVRLLRYDPASGLDRLELQRIARSSADQRAGRAGRLGPGLTVRLWSGHEDRGLRPQEAPEVARVDLTGAILQLLAWGEADAAAFPWFEAPSEAAITQATDLLRSLGALDTRGVTARGQAMARLGVPPRLARLLLAGHAAGTTRAAARIAALLSERDIVKRRIADGPRTSPGAADMHPTAESDSDVLDRLWALGDLAKRGWGETPFGPIERGRGRRVLQIAEHLERRVRNVGDADEGNTDGGNAGGSNVDRGNAGAETERDTLLRIILTADPDRVARRRGPRDPRAVMVDGRGVRLSDRSAVRDAGLFVCVELMAGRGHARGDSLVFQASAIDTAWLASLGPGLTETDEVHFDSARQRVVGRRQQRFGTLVLEEKEQPASADDAARCLVDAAAHDLDAALPLDDTAVAQFRLRVDRLRDWLPEAGLPALDEDTLRTLLPVLASGCRSFADLRRAPLLDCLRGTLDHAHLALIDREAPERIALPSGWHQRLRYEAAGPPVLAVRIQDLFGVATTPTIARGRVEVLLHLLAPNMRPQQVTQDLASFWDNTYPIVRKELAGRYPKHPWPDDPRTATPPTRRRHQPRKRK